jgi:hypothetical protein
MIHNTVTIIKNVVPAIRILPSAVEIFFPLVCCVAQTGVMQKTATLHCTISHKSTEINFIFEDNQLWAYLESNCGKTDTEQYKQFC